MTGMEKANTKVVCSTVDPNMFAEMAQEFTHLGQVVTEKKEGPDQKAATYQIESTRGEVCSGVKGCEEVRRCEKEVCESV